MKKITPLKGKRIPLQFSLTILALLLIMGSMSAKSTESAIPTKGELITDMIRANQYWQNNNPDPGRSFWDNAAYHTGNIEAYKITGIETFRDYSILWSEQNQWMGATSNDTASWRYSYGESSNYVLFGDWQICFQTYIDLYNLAEEKDSVMIQRALGVMEYQMSTDNVDYWWWVDGLYMVMPVMTKLYKLTGNELYLQKLSEYFAYAKGIMWDEEEGLFYRDGNYVYPDHTTLSGKKDFWARGDGWIFAGLAKILQDIPEESEYRTEFVNVYDSLAVALSKIQMEEGYWTRSLLDEEQAPGYETSGTAFFTYAYFWGINNGLLDSATYTPIALKGLQYLREIALQDDGSVGYVQPIGSAAVPGQILYTTTTANFGVGAFLLAFSEASRWAEGDFPLYTESVSVADENQIEVTFSEALDTESATKLDNYAIEDVVITSVTVSEDGKSVVLMCDEIPVGQHVLVLNNLSSVTGKSIVNETSITFTKLSSITVTASAYQSGNPPENTLDYDFGTRWSAESTVERNWENGNFSETINPQWIQFDLGKEKVVSSVSIAFYSGSQRSTTFQISLSEDGENFTMVFDGSSSGETDDLEEFDFEDADTRYVRLTCYGNSQSNWNSMTEVRINLSDNTTAANEITQSEPKLSLYPNPYTNGVLTVISAINNQPLLMLSIVDLNGRVQYSQSIKETEQTNSTILIPQLHLQEGVYSLIVQNELGFESSKLVVN